METRTIHSVYFSATFTTRRIVREITSCLTAEVVEHDVTCDGADIAPIVLGRTDLLVIGMPVYAGRIPQDVVRRIANLKGDGTPAIIVAVYGNRDYDDALLELRDVVMANGFRVVSAGAFIARHSIFPSVATDRPDAGDIACIREFAGRSGELVQSIDADAEIPAINVKGNYPYKTPGTPALKPVTSAECVGCGACAEQCPVSAITVDGCAVTDNARCITCGRCLVVCPVSARIFPEPVYSAAGAKFHQAYSALRPNETYYM